MKPMIKWNADKFGGEIKTDKEHFVISAQPSMAMSWDDAVRFYKHNKKWRFPSREELLLVAANINEVNNIIKAGGGYKMEGWFWSAEEAAGLYAWLVIVGYGDTFDILKYNNHYVRAVCTLND